MLMGCTLPPGPPGPSPPGGGVSGNCGFCSSAMFFSHSGWADFMCIVSSSGTFCDHAEMCAKWLHLQEVMRKRNTGNYSTEPSGVELARNLLGGAESRHKTNW